MAAAYHLALVCIAAVLPMDASAATVPYLTDGQLVAASERIVHARVLQAHVAVDTDGLIHTTTEFIVLEDLTGIPDSRIAVTELGGAIGGQSLVVPGTPHFEVGDEVVLCLERGAHGTWRTSALSRAAYVVARTTPESVGAVLTPESAGLDVVGRPRTEPPPPSLQEFRTLVSSIKGTTPWRSPAASAVAPPAASRPEGGIPAAAAFTLLGSGVRWFESDRGSRIVWYRNVDTQAPLAGTGESEITTALAAWTTPQTASIELRYGGIKSIGQGSPFCSSANAGEGLITFDDPTNEMASNVLAIGGGCVSAVPAKTVNGVAFRAFSHGFVVFNRASVLGAAYHTPLSVARILEHEIGHGIGLGHVNISSSGAALNIMFPACCLSTTPVPPALGPDDLAGLEFIYPSFATSQSCSYSVSPLNVAFSGEGGSAQFTVATSATCAWAVEDSPPWVTVAGGAASRSGSGSVSYSVAPNNGAGRQAVIRVAGVDVAISQGSDDTDGDGLPDTWETQFGLNPTSAAGNDGSAGDPDGDHRSNADEWRDDTHPRGFYRRYFAEGATGTFFDVRLAILNASPSSTAHLLVRALTVSGVRGRLSFDLASRGRRTVRPAVDLDLPSAEFATIVESDQPVVADRTMSWGNGQYGAHAETGVASPASRWYFAEGATHSGFDLFYLLSNPNLESVDVVIRYLRPAPLAPIVRSYRVGPQSRRTVWVNVEDPGLAATDVAAMIVSPDTLPVIAERAMYLSRPGRPFVAGHDAEGATAPATDWWFAEGATGDFFDTFLLVSNPTSNPASLDVRYLLPTGQSVVTQRIAPANARFTLWVDREDPRLAKTAFAVEIRSTNGVPVVAERAMWWPGPTASTWEEAHANMGSAVTATRWATADVEVGGPSSVATFLLIANTTAAAGLVKVTLVFEDAPGTTASRTFRMNPTSRLNVDVGVEFPEARGRRAAAFIESVGSPTLALFVERATYWNADGRMWGAGTAASAVAWPDAPRVNPN
jgi:hypothetical protein